MPSAEGSSDKNMLVGNGRIDLSPEHLKAFPSGRESDRFQLVTAGIGGYGAIKACRVLRNKRLQVAWRLMPPHAAETVCFISKARRSVNTKGRA